MNDRLPLNQLAQRVGGGWDWSDTFNVKDVVDVNHKFPAVMPLYRETVGLIIEWFWHNQIIISCNNSFQNNRLTV